MLSKYVFQPPYQSFVLLYYVKALPQITCMLHHWLISPTSILNCSFSWCSCRTWLFKMNLYFQFLHDATILLLRCHINHESCEFVGKIIEGLFIHSFHICSQHFKTFQLYVWVFFLHERNNLQCVKLPGTQNKTKTDKRMQKHTNL